MGQMRKTSAYLDPQQDAVIWASIERNSDAEGDTRFGWNHAEARGQARSRLTAWLARPLCRVHSGQRRSRTRAFAQPSWDRIQISIACRAVEIFGLFFLECAVTNGAFGAASFFSRGFFSCFS